MKDKNPILYFKVAIGLAPGPLFTKSTQRFACPQTTRSRKIDIHKGHATLASRKLRPRIHAFAKIFAGGTWPTAKYYTHTQTTKSTAFTRLFHYICTVTFETVIYKHHKPSKKIGYFVSKTSTVRQHNLNVSNRAIRAVISDYVCILHAQWW